MNEIFSKKWKLGILFSSDTYTTIDFITKVIKSNAEEDNEYIYFVIIDTSHIITPDVLIEIPENLLTRIYIIKPSSIAAVSIIIDRIITHTRLPNKTIIIMTSLYLQIPYDLWSKYNYDPIYTIYGIANLVRKSDKIQFVIIVDTQIDEKPVIRYQDVLNELADWILRGYFKDETAIYQILKEN